MIPFLIFIFSVACIVRLIPELVAYSIPIGSDVVHYYIPVVEHFETSWPKVFQQFPLYVSIAALKNQPQKHGYFIVYNSKTPEEIINNESLSKIYSSDKFTIFQISDVH